MTRGTIDGSKQKGANGHMKYVQIFAAEKEQITIQRLKWSTS
jgi:hypothetical protein